MILLAVLLAAQTAPLPIAPDDIVVTARRRERLRRLSITVKRDRATGSVRCFFKRRSGQPALDAAVCNAALACAQTAKVMEELRACIAPTMDALIEKGVPWRAGAAKDGR